MDDCQLADELYKSVTKMRSSNILVDDHQPPSDIITLEGHMSNSIFLENLDGNTVIVNGKVKHLMLINCSSLTIKLENAPIVGIYILRSKNIRITVDGKLPYLAVETSSSVNVNFDLDTGFTLTNHYSCDIIINGDDTNANMFVSVTIRMMKDGQLHLVSYDQDNTISLMI